MIIFTSVLYAFTFVAYRYTVQNDAFNDWPKISLSNLSKKSNEHSWVINKNGTPESIFDGRIEQVLASSLGKEKNDLKDWLFSSKEDKSPAVIPNYDPKILKERLEPILMAYERYNKAKLTAIDKSQDSESASYVSVISSLMLTLGVVGFILLVIQTAVTFIRYYVRLAELYEAQADALEASDGDSEVAINFIEKFSPTAIEFGKLPISLYEKSFEAVIEIAKSKK